MKKESPEQKYTISPSAQQLDSGRWKPVCVVYRFESVIDMTGEKEEVDCQKNTFHTREEAIEAALVAADNWINEFEHARSSPVQTKLI